MNKPGNECWTSNVSNSAALITTWTRAAELHEKSSVPQDNGKRVSEGWIYPAPSSCSTVCLSCHWLPEVAFPPDQPLSQRKGSSGSRRKRNRHDEWVPGAPDSNAAIFVSAKLVIGFGPLGQSLSYSVLIYQM